MKNKTNERTYFVRFKKPRSGEYGYFANDLELLTLSQLNEIKEECEFIMESGYVIETTVTQCVRAIRSAVNTHIWTECGENPTCIVMEE